MNGFNNDGVSIKETDHGFVAQVSVMQPGRGSAAIRIGHYRTPSELNDEVIEALKRLNVRQPKLDLSHVAELWTEASRKIHAEHRERESRKAAA